MFKSLDWITGEHDGCYTMGVIANRGEKDEQRASVKFPEYKVLLSKSDRRDAREAMIKHLKENQ